LSLRLSSNFGWFPRTNRALFEQGYGPGLAESEELDEMKITTIKELLYQNINYIRIL